MYFSCNRIQPLFGSTNKENKVEEEPAKDKSEESRQSTEQSQQQPEAATTETSEVDALKAENKQLLERVMVFDDKFKRALAEGENQRIRMKRQIDEAKIFGIQGFCKDLLEVADVLEKALESVPKEELGKNDTLKTLFTGVEMTEQQLQSVFRRHGLVKLNPIGEKFNPNEHHALFEAVEEGKEPGTVAIVTKIGYKLHERTLRPAMVGVVKAP